MVKKKAPKGFAVYEENKSTKLHLTLTPTGLNLLNEMAEAASLSRSELVERLVRGTLDQGTSAAISATPELPAEVSQRLADQERQVTEQRQTIAQLQQQIAQLQSQMHQAAATPPDQTAQVAQLQAQIAQLQADNQQRVDGAVVQSLQDTITQLKGELETLRSAAPAASTETLAQLQNLLNAERTLAASRLDRALAAEAEVDRQIKERYQLERRLNSLQGLVSLAENQLNRWRH